MENKNIIKLSLLFFIIVINLCFSCEKENSGEDTIWIYKTKNDYSDKVPVQLSKDKSEIKSFPGPYDVDNRRFKPLNLIKGYYLNGSLGPNTGYLSLTIEEYSKYETPLSRDSMYSLLIDKDPFIKFYARYDDKGFRNENVSPYGIDTAKINDIIRQDELDKYFERMK